MWVRHFLTIQPCRRLRGPDLVDQSHERAPAAYNAQCLRICGLAVLFLRKYSDLRHIGRRSSCSVRCAFSVSNTMIIIAHIFKLLAAFNILSLEQPVIPYAFSRSLLCFYLRY